MKKFITLSTLLILPFLSIAQKDYWQGGLFVGLTAFSGDINPQSTPDLSDVSIAIGVSGKVDVTPKVGFKGSLNYAKLVGDDANYESRISRGFKFNTTLIELIGVAEWEPFGSDRYYSDAGGNVVMDKLISPYLYLGAGLGFANLNTDFSRYEGANALIRQGIQADRTQGSSKTAFIIPAGVGVKIDITNSISVAVDFGARLSFSDYLDGISQSANPERDDIYFLSGLNLFYRFFN
jgi:hypothetical protein